MAALRSKTRKTIRLRRNKERRSDRFGSRHLSFGRRGLSRQQGTDARVNAAWPIWAAPLHMTVRTDLDVKWPDTISVWKAGWGAKPGTSVSVTEISPCGS